MLKVNLYGMVTYTRNFMKIKTKIFQNSVLTNNQKKSKHHFKNKKKIQIACLKILLQKKIKILNKIIINNKLIKLLKKNYKIIVIKMKKLVNKYMNKCKLNQIIFNNKKKMKIFIIMKKINKKLNNKSFKVFRYI